jgi:hypothetical protein
MSLITKFTYLAAKDKRGIRYCLVEEGHRLDKIGSAGRKRLVEHFQRPDYQTVLDGRPLLFVFGQPTTSARKVRLHCERFANRRWPSC